MHSRLSRFLPLLGLVALAVSVRAQLAPYADSSLHEPGSVDGTLLPPPGTHDKSVAGIAVTVLETGQSVTTDRYGQFMFKAIAPGTYTLIASADGYSRLRITDVVVQPGHSLSLSPQTMPIVVKDGEVQMMEEVVVSARKDVEVMEKFEVTDTAAKIAPFSTANMDIQRTIDDPQPYYMFDSNTIENSGVSNLEDFFQQRLSMNAESRPVYDVGSNNNLGTSTTSVNLRGLGTNQTLILIDGRRSAAVNSIGNSTPIDFNGIPLDAIDHIEVLPSSAAAIYGASALGGVINIVLKRDYSGGIASFSYDNTFNTDAAVKTYNLSYGGTLNGGKTHFMFATTYSTASSLEFQDQSKLYDRGLDAFLSVYSQFPVTTSGSPYAYGSGASATMFVGSLPNISSETTANLVLKNGTSLNSPITYIPAGYTATSSPAGLVADAGSYNLTPPNSRAQPWGTARDVDSPLSNKSLIATVNHELTPYIELYGEVSTMSNIGYTNSNIILTDALSIAATNPNNPFQQAVYVTIPDQSDVTWFADNVTHAATGGVIVKLPHDWKVEADYTWNLNSLSTVDTTYDTTDFAVDYKDGVINPFVDTSRYPLNVTPYVGQYFYNFNSTLDDLTVRASGSLWRLPAGAPTLTIGLEQRSEGLVAGTTFQSYPSYPSDNFANLYPGKRQRTRSAYMEADVPVISPANKVPGVNLFDFQLTGRTEDYYVSTTTGVLNPYAAVPTVIELAHTDYRSTNPTVAARYKPVDGLMFRASYGTGFLPPTYSQLIPGLASGEFLTSVTDPERGNSTVSVEDLSGGNPDLKPQTSSNWDAGAVFEPTFLKGFRFDVEWYRIIEHNAIGTLSPQVIVNDESLFPDRVIRAAPVAGDPYGVGVITTVNTENLNLTELKTAGYDVSADYRFETQRLGTFELSGLMTFVRSYKTQTTLNSLLVEYAGIIGNSGPLKQRGNATLTWQLNPWTFGWTTRYYGSYYPLAVSTAAVTAMVDDLIQGGSDSIKAQYYHDVFASYHFGSRTLGANASALQRALHGLQLTVLIKNVFDTYPPIQGNNQPAFVSVYDADYRLREYVLTLRKAF